MAEVIITNHADYRYRLVIITIEVKDVSKDYISLVKRTLEEQLYNELQQDYGFPRAICRSLTELFFSYFNLYLGADRADGQLIYRAIPSDVPPGVPTEEVKTHPVRLTITCSEDLRYASQEIHELIKQRIVRVTNEAFDQDGLLTQADLSILLGESTRTIGRHIQELQKEGICVPTRGSRMDIGPGISHKTKIVEMYLDGYDFTDIKRRTRHSSESITRYLRDFARVMVLSERGHSPREIRIITDHSDRLVQEYLGLYQKMNTPEHGEMLNQLRAMYQHEGKKNDVVAGEDIIGTCPERMEG
jgi:hypothetical protein